MTIPDNIEENQENCTDSSKENKRDFIIYDKLRIFMEIIIGLLAVGLYFLPTIIGWQKRNAGAIFVLNLLLGWTLIGWVVALVWAMTYDTK